MTIKLKSLRPRRIRTFLTYLVASYLFAMSFGLAKGTEKILGFGPTWLERLASYVFAVVAAYCIIGILAIFTGALAIWISGVDEEPSEVLIIEAYCLAALFPLVKEIL